MLKQYFLIGILVITTALSVSAFTSASSSGLVGQAPSLVSLNAAVASGYPYGDSPYLSVVSQYHGDSFIPSIAVTGFQTPRMTDYISIPSIGVIGFQTPPMTAYVPSGLYPLVPGPHEGR